MRSLTAQSLARRSPPPANIETALAAYEKDLFARSAQAATEAAQVTKLLFGKDAPYRLIEVFERDMMGTLGS